MVMIKHVGSGLLLSVDWKRQTDQWTPELAEASRFRRDAVALETMEKFGLDSRFYEVVQEGILTQRRRDAEEEKTQGRTSKKRSYPDGNWWQQNKGES
jgi:hypothetical protein